MANPSLCLFIFDIFQTNNTILQQINVKKWPSSIRCRDSNPWPLKHETSPITTRPGLLPYLNGQINYLKSRIKILPYFTVPIVTSDTRGAVVNVIKLFEEIEIGQKIRNLIKFVLMSEPAQKCQNYDIFKQNYTLELLINFKMAHSCCFRLGGNL